MTDYDEELLEKEMQRTRIKMMQMKDCTFFITIIFSLKIVWDDSCKTAWTDGYNMGWCPAFFMGKGEIPLTPNQRPTIMAHEAMHVALLHCTPEFMDAGYIHWIMNQAMDHVINLMLLERGFDVPQWMCQDARFKGMHTLEVYKILLKEYENGQLEMKNLLDDLRKSDKPEDEQKDHIIDMIMLGNTQSEMAQDKGGSVPDEIQIFLKKLLEPKLPWYQILQRYMKALGKNDYSTRKPNKRYFPGFYLPSLFSEAVQDLTFALDISGSVSQKQFTQFVSDIGKVLGVMKPKKVTVILFDTRIISINEVKDIKELLAIKFKGGGGTAPRPVFDWAEENSSDLLLVFTDGCFDEDELKDKTPVNTVWLINDNPHFKAKFGKVVYFDT